MALDIKIAKDQWLWACPVDGCGGTGKIQRGK